MSAQHRQVVYGLAFLVVLVLLVGLTVAAYQGRFRDTVDVTLRSDRAGLTMDSGAVVKLRGVEVGEVDRVEPDGDGALVHLSLDADQVAAIPADVTAQIVPPTAFGAKYVQLTAPGATAGRAIAAGDVIEGERVTVEVDQTFTYLTRVLNVARPADVDAALTSLATTLDGRGEQIGALVSQVDGYLTSFNPSLPTLTTDLRRSQAVLDAYDATLPDLLSAATDVSTTASTITDQQASLQALLVSLRSFSGETRSLVRSTRTDLVSSLDRLAPVTQVLERYSPELPCIIRGVVVQKRLAEQVVGGTNPGITTHTRLRPGDRPYTYPRDLPEVGDTRGPGCYGLPLVTATSITPDPPLRTGTDPADTEGPATGDGAEDLAESFLGDLADLLGGRR